MNYNEPRPSKCSWCGSEGTNKSTCPLNSIAINPNIQKHPNAAAVIASQVNVSQTAASAPSSPKKQKHQIDYQQRLAELGIDDVTFNKILQIKQHLTWDEIYKIIKSIKY